MATFRRAWDTFFWLTLGTVISGSLTTCALCASLLSWFHGLSPLDNRSVRAAFGNPSVIFGFVLGPPPLLLASVIIISVLPVPKCLSILLIPAIVVSVFYYVRTNWHPCSAMSHIEHGPSAIPGAMSACRQMTALNALALINLFSCFGFLIAIGGNAIARTTCTPKYRARVNINNDRPQDDNEVDLREMAHHLDTLDNV